MTWLVFGVSCLLVLAGAVSIISGAPIIQLERGWAEVISGTVALSSGGVVFALAGILMRLESIRDAMAARMVPVAAEGVPAPAPTPYEKRIEALLPVAAADPLPETTAALARAAFQPDAEVAPEPDAAAADPEGPTQALWKRVKRPGDERPTVETMRQHGFPDRMVPDEPETAPNSTSPAVVVPAHAVPVVPPAPLVPAPPIEAVARDTVPADADAGQIGWLERSLFKARAARGDEIQRPEPSFGVRPTAGGEIRAEPVLVATEPAPEPRKPSQDSNAIVEPEPTPDLASELHKDASVIGRYQAGSASYVMYSDGTIEVETESGEMHRFGSMEELKAFIAQQDAPVI